jgi:hypothetical protein
MHFSSPWRSSTRRKALPLLLEALRIPRVIRYLVASPLIELRHELLRADANGTPEIEISVENGVIGLITSLRPLLIATVNAFFELDASEHTRRETILAQHEKEDSAWRAENQPDDEDYEQGPIEKAVCGAHKDLEAAAFRLGMAERQQLALDLINKPDAMIRDAMAVRVFERVLELTRVVERWTRDESAAYFVALNHLGNILPVLRDLRRTLT